MPAAKRWASLAALASAAVPLSLILPWFRGGDDTGSYTATGWGAFDDLDTQLTATAVVAFACAVAILARPRLAASLSLLSGIAGVFVVAQVVRLGLLGHADGDPSLHHPTVGVYVAIAAGVVLATASAVLRSSGELPAARFGPTS